MIKVFTFPPFDIYFFTAVKLFDFIAIKEAILEGEIQNEYQAAYDFILKKGGKLGLKINDC